MSSGIARSYGARAKEHLRVERDKALAPYEALKVGIDKLLIDLDVAKARFQQGGGR